MATIEVIASAGSYSGLSRPSTRSSQLRWAEACRAKWLTIAALLCPTGCSPAPSQNILGSFFPAWLLCAGIGVAAAVACRVVLGAVRLDKQVLAPPLGYLAVAIAVTLFTWLYRFGQ